MSKKEKKRENRLKSTALVNSIVSTGYILLQVLSSQFSVFVLINQKGVTLR